MHHDVAQAISMFAVLALCSIVIVVGCGRKRQNGESLDATTHSFAIHWPPVDPDVTSADTSPPLLRGDVSLREIALSGRSAALEIELTIKRPSNEEDRVFWNSQLAFSDVPWMDEVRVWDLEHKWQWPNLPYLLRRHGEERVERYGGIDPGKLVDNDFAAVLIRKFDADGKVESQDTVTTPLVSAEWRSPGGPDTDIHSLVHTARSETFVVHVGAGDDHARGMVKLWLIYADFLGSRPPRSWPKEREWAGGILAYCEIHWDQLPGEPCRGTVRFIAPPDSTGFEWEKWSDDTVNPAQSRLRDMMK